MGYQVKACSKIFCLSENLPPGVTVIIIIITMYYKNKGHQMAGTETHSAYVVAPYPLSSTSHISNILQSYQPKTFQALCTRPSG